MKRLKRSLLLIFVFLSLNSLASETFDVMDTAYLWPFGFQNGSWSEPTMDLLPIYTNGSDDILSSTQKEIFLKIIKFASNDHESSSEVGMFNVLKGKLEASTNIADSWVEVIQGGQKVYMSSFRFEICGPGIQSTKEPIQEFKQLKWNGKKVLMEKTQEECHPRIQIVGQHGISDSAAHFIYILPKKFTQSIVGDLLDLKKASPVKTNGLPLGVHPGLLHPTKGNEFNQRVVTFVRRYALAEYLSEIAVIATNEFDGGDQWNFTAVELSNGGATFQMKNQLALEGQPISHGFGVTLSSQKSVGLSKNLVRTRYYDEDKKRDVNMPVEEIVDAIEELVHPAKSSIKSVDCKSCHSPSGHIRDLLKHPQAFGLPPSFRLFDDTQLFQTQSKIYYTPGITGFPDSRYLPLEGRNFRAFGWFMDRPTVNLRVAMKAAAVTNAINEFYFKSGNVLSGPNCEAQKGSLLVCLYTHAGEESDCLQRYCK